MSMILYIYMLLWCYQSSLFLPKTASVHPVIDPELSACSVLASSEKLKVLFLTVKTAAVTLPYLCLSSTFLSTVASV